MPEAYYLLAIINSDALYEAVTPLMPKGQFGSRDLDKAPVEVAHTGV